MSKSCFDCGFKDYDDFDGVTFCHEIGKIISDQYDEHFETNDVACEKYRGKEDE